MTVVTGLPSRDCADEVSANYDREEVAGLRHIIAEARERKAGREKAQAVLADEGLTAAWDLFVEWERSSAAYDEAYQRVRSSRVRCGHSGGGWTPGISAKNSSTNS